MFVNIYKLHCTLTYVSGAGWAAPGSSSLGVSPVPNPDDLNFIVAVKHGTSTVPVFTPFTPSPCVLSLAANEWFPRFEIFSSTRCKMMSKKCLKGSRQGRCGQARSHDVYSTATNPARKDALNRQRYLSYIIFPAIRHGPQE